MGSKRKTNDVMAGTEDVKIVPQYVEKPVVADEAAPQDETVEGEAVEAEAVEAAAPKKKVGRTRSSKYQAVRSQVDKTKKYEVSAAIELLKKLSYTAFDGTVTAHLVVKEAGITFSLAFPFSTGKSVRVAIVDDKLLSDIAAGKIEFDILLASPEYMPKLAKFAPVLGPKGLMPNPKNGTLTKDVAGAKKKLEGGTTTIKTEKKAPLMHVRLGKVSMPTKELAGNLTALIQSGSTKIVSVAVAASMSPGIKVDHASVVEAAE